MRKLSFVALAALLFAAAPVRAISLAFLPAALNVNVGDPFTVDVVVSGLGNGVAPSLGSYDLDVSFDSSQLAFDSLTFGSELGGPADSLQSFGAVAGVVDLAEVSFLSPAELDALQPDAFTLATLHFTALAEGTSGLAFSQAIAGDGFGRPLEAARGTASVTVARANPGVPEPSAFALFALGAALIAGRGARTRAVGARARPARGGVPRA